jgi:hypothetical protein
MSSVGGCGVAGWQTPHVYAKLGVSDRAAAVAAAYEARADRV